MKKILQGKYALSCTKEEAIDRLREMAGYCREELDYENQVFFSCTKKGKIAVCGCSHRRYGLDNNTWLHAQIVEETDKTYITYYTQHHKVNAVLNLILGAVNVITGVIVIVYARTLMALLAYGLILAMSIREMYAVANGDSNAWQDSEILRKVLEERVNAVNRWDE